MKIVFDDERTKYEIDIEPTAETDEIEGLYVCISTDNGQETFEGVIPKIIPDVNEFNK